MNRIYTIVLLSLLSLAHAFGQGQKYTFAEAGGPGVFLTANFDMRFNPGSREGWGSRAGVGHSFLFVDSDEMRAFIFPVGINYLHGKNGSDFLFGLDATPVFLYGEGIRSTVGGVAIAARPLIVPEIGYRYRPMKSGIGFHFSYTPIFNTVDGTMPVFLGVGIGYSWR